MKPLPTVPLTHEDLEAYSYCYGFVEGQSWDALMIYVRIADRRDAVLMRWLSRMRVAHYGRAPRLPPQACIPIAHLCVAIDAEWPRGHLGIDLT